MDSSNMGVETTGDIEAQRPNPSWFVSHKHTLRPNQDAEVNKLGYYILKVPDYLQQPPNAFSPAGWRFGLHNRENLDNNGSEAIKLGVALQYGLVGEKWNDFCDAIVDNPKAMLACYDLQDVMTGWTDEEIKHLLALDALFLAFFFDKCLPLKERRLSKWNTMSSPFAASNLFDTRFDNWKYGILNDLYQVENQVPLVLVDKVFDYIIRYDSSVASEGNESEIDDLQYRQSCVEFVAKHVAKNFMDTSSEAFESDFSSDFHEKTHLFGTLYDVICGSNGSFVQDSSQRTTIYIPSATKLEQSGIKIVGVDKPLCEMTYKENLFNLSLELPKMKMFDHTPFFIRNMLYYEVKDEYGGCVFSDYITFMLDLIKAPEDVDLLIERGVIDNGCGVRTFGMWKALDEGLVILPSSKKRNKMKEDILSRCKHRRYKLWSEFQIVFCSRPWFVLSTIAIVLVTMATLVQTYIAIISSNKMKPNFP